MKGIRDYLDTEGLTGTCDLISLAGAAKNLAAPMAAEHGRCAEDQLRLSKELHGVSEMILMNHLDCGAYGGRSAFASDDEERKTHIADLKRAGAILRETYPDVAVRLVIASLGKDGESVVCKTIPA